MIYSGEKLFYTVKIFKFTNHNTERNYKRDTAASISILSNSAKTPNENSKMKFTTFQILKQGTYTKNQITDKNTDRGKLRE